MNGNLNHLTNAQLIEATERCIKKGNENTAELLVHLAEVDARRLYLEHAHPSMFAYCTEQLHLDGGAAYKRINAARAARRCPLILEMLAAGDIHLSGIVLIAAHLTADNHRALLQRIRHQSKREIEKIVAELQPRPDVAASMRRRPAPRVRSEPMVTARGSVPEANPPPAAVSKVASARVEPLAPTRYKLQLTASQQLVDKIHEAQDLLRHQIPDGDLARVIERAMAVLVDELKRKKFGRRKRQPTRVNKEAPESSGSEQPEQSSRHIPNAIKRRVAERDGERCTYESSSGQRCTATGMLEFHHVLPYGKHPEHLENNITLRCRPHNQHAAEQDYGKAFIASRRQRRSPVETAPVDLGRGSEQSPGTVGSSSGA